MEDARQAAIARDNADAEAKTILDAARVDAAKFALKLPIKLKLPQVLCLRRMKMQETLKPMPVQMQKQNAIAFFPSCAARLPRFQLRQPTNWSVSRWMNNVNAHWCKISLQKVPAEVTRFEGTSAEITSALPLTADEQSAAKRSIGVENVAFKVDRILGGLVVRVGDQVVDDSVAGQMSTLRDSLN